MTADERKARERDYYSALGADAVATMLDKPFVAAEAGRLLVEIGAALSLMPEPPAKVIDYGCGTGWTTYFLARHGLEATGVDLAPDAIAGAAATFRLPNLRYATRDFDADPPESDFYDAALFFDALHHADDERVPLRNAFAALRPGGLLVACEPGTGHAAAESSVEAVRLYGVNERDMTPRQVIAAARQVGFVDQRVYPHPHVVHGLYRTRKSSRLGHLSESLARAVYSVFNQRRWGLVTLKKPE